MRKHTYEGNGKMNTATQRFTPEESGDNSPEYLIPDRIPIKIQRGSEPHISAEEKSLSIFKRI